MKIEVQSKEYIKPSSPTPKSLKNYKLSLADQLALNFKIPFVLFYDSSADSSATHELKKSLSQTLSLMYPLAGRLKEDKVTIECNDEGVEFIEAHVAEKMSCLLDIPKVEILRQLIPCNPSTGAYEPCPVGNALAVIQLNRFSCGGIAIGLIVSHAVADALSIATFLNTWAAINRGCTVNGDGFIFDCSRMFPPLISFSPIERLARLATETTERSEKYAVQRFVFSGPSVAHLREQLRFNNGQTPTRTEALTAVVWAAVITAINKKHYPKIIKVHELSSVVNLRLKMDPPLPPNCLGNVLSRTTVIYEGTGGSAINCHSLVKKIRESLRAVNDEFARKNFGEGGYLRSALGGDFDKIILDEPSEEVNSYHLQTSSLCGLPYYKVDFGWGNPRWVVDVILPRDLVILIDANNGGIEAWIGLPKDVMNILMQDHYFLGYVSKL